MTGPSTRRRVAWASVRCAATSRTRHPSQRIAVAFGADRVLADRDESQRAAYEARVAAAG